VKTFGAQNMTGILRRVLVKRPGPAMADADPDAWNYHGSLDLVRLQANFDDFVAVLKKSGGRVEFIDQDADELADACFTHDPSLVTDRGAVLLRMGKDLRQGEVELHAEAYQTHDVPILGRIKAPGTVEGGDCLWLDERTLAVGCGYRTNEAGINQLRSILAPLNIEVLSYDLPVLAGPHACLHLMSLISIVDVDLALVHSPLMPVRFYQALGQRGVSLIEAPADEFMASGAISVNVLATSPRHCVMAAGWTKTQAVLLDHGCTVDTFDGSELCHKAEGGPTCLTRPILRD